MGDDHRAKRQVDFIIVGQGIAGTLLAHDLLEKGHSVYIIDKPMIASASKVAAGLINPVGMKRCIPSWQADVFLPFAFKRYQSLEKKLETSFFTQKPIYRLFANKANRKEWQIKHSNEGMDQYITDFEYVSSQPFLKDEIGGATISPTAFLDTVAFLRSSRDYFLQQKCLVEEVFNFERLIPSSCTYNSIKASNIIFCEGFRAINNPYFKHLPFSPTKGELLIIHIPDVEKMQKILSKGIFIIPLGDHLYRVGATYHHQQWDDSVTKQGREYLKQKIKQILKVDFTIISEKAGVRPTTKDRKPLLGIHNTYQKLAIFNGLGSRGALQGPYLSAQFCGFLTNTEKTTKLTDNKYIRYF